MSNQVQCFSAHGKFISFIRVADCLHDIHKSYVGTQQEAEMVPLFKDDRYQKEDVKKIRTSAAVEQTWRSKARWNERLYSRVLASQFYVHLIWKNH